MADKYHHITIALAGICQSALLVPQLANTGQCDTHLYNISLKSILNTSPTSTKEVFDGLANIRDGLEFLILLLSNNQQDKEKFEVMDYIFSTLRIAVKLLKKTNELEQISQRLQRIKSLYGHELDNKHQAQHDQLSYSLAGIYTDIISPLTTKIRVKGKIEYLQNSLIQAKVRSALFGCVRAAILWYQVGGNRWHFLFARKKIINAANDLLQQ